MGNYSGKHCQQPQQPNINDDIRVSPEAGKTNISVISEHERCIDYILDSKEPLRSLSRRLQQHPSLRFEKTRADRAKVSSKKLRSKHTIAKQKPSNNKKPASKWSHHGPRLILGR
jgi:hypothetical protein